MNIYQCIKVTCRGLGSLINEDYVGQKIGFGNALQVLLDPLEFLKSGKTLQKPFQSPESNFYLSAGSNNRITS